VANSPKQVVTAHYMMHWGLPKFHIQEPDPFELAVVEFTPGKQWGPMPRLETYRFATNGMHNYLQSYKGRDFRTELYVSTRTTAPWVISFLANLARYPMLHQTRFGEYHTIPSIEPLQRNGTVYARFLLAPPEPEDAWSMGVIWNATSEPIHVHQVVGITQTEYEFALRHPTGEVLWKRLVALGRPLLLDEVRPHAVPDSP
jgi:hypothetical protein